MVRERERLDFVLVAYNFGVWILGFGILSFVFAQYLLHA